MPLPSSTSTLKRLDATLGYLLCKVIGRIRHYAGLPELAPDPDPATIRRILIIRPGGMGDMLMLLPIIRSIRHALPNAQVDIVCEKRNHEVLRLAGLEAHAILYDAAPWRILSLRSGHYDVVIDTEQFHNFSAIMAWLSGAHVRIGFRINPVRLSLYTHLIGYDVEGYELDQFARLLRPLGISLVLPTLDGALADSPPPLDEQVLSSVAALRLTGPVVAISPGSSDPYKQWGHGNFAELMRDLLARGAGIALVGGRNERDQAGELTRNAGSDRVVNCVATCTLTQTAAVLHAASLFIGGDSGLGHLAVALARPTVTIFGPSDPRKWSRPGKNHRILRRDLPCSPCSIFGYRKLCRDIPCMSGISVAEVLKAAEELLPTTGPAHPATS